jgi:hypothetical protein
MQKPTNFFFSSYDIFAASLLTLMLGIVYYPGVGKMPTSSDTAIKLATSAGTVIGQFGFGTLADIVRPMDTVFSQLSRLVLTICALGRPQENVWSGAHDHYLCDGCSGPDQWLSLHGCVRRKIAPPDW